MAPRTRTVVPLTWEQESRLERARRRERLNHLDRLLTVLEELNLRGETALSTPLRDALEHEGIVCPPGAALADVIERVLDGQGDFLLHPAIAREATSQSLPSRAARSMSFGSAG
ncbi:MAG TPA: hypothetical protein VMW49_03480 [Candidatus Dormibacteraeota bacterium]|nr:hypothetical protein [Candidatus Dormibacteraeota bacterium]